MRRIIFTALLLFCVFNNHSLQAAEPEEGTPAGKVITEVVKSGHPDWFGELVNYTVESGSGNLRNALADFQKTGATEALKAAAAKQAYRKYVQDELAKASNAFEWLAYAMEVSENAANEKYGEVGWSTGLLVLKRWGSARLAAMQASSLPLTTAIAAVQIWRQSKQAAYDAETGVMVEALYGRMEIMLRTPGRTLGDGSDPFPVTKENVNLVYTRIINEPDFREQFHRYAIEVAGVTWPEPGVFDSAWMYLSSPSQGGTQYDEATEQQLEENATQIKGLIAVIIKELNDGRKADEARIVAIKALKELTAHFKGQSSSLEEGMRRLDQAIDGLPKTMEYADAVGARVDKAIADKDYIALLTIRQEIVAIFRDELRWIPDVEPFGSVKAQPTKQLLAAFENAGGAATQLRSQLEEQAKDPEPPPDAPPTTEVFFEKYLVKHIQPPYTWDDTGGPEGVKAVFLGYLQNGHYLADHEKALVVMQAWRIQNYVVACNGPHTPGVVPTPPHQKTIEGYVEAMRQAVAEPLIMHFDTRSGGGLVVVDGVMLTYTDRKAVQDMTYGAIEKLAALAKGDYQNTLDWMTQTYDFYQAEAARHQERMQKIHNQVFGEPRAVGQTRVDVGFTADEFHPKYGVADNLSEIELPDSAIGLIDNPWDSGDPVDTNPARLPDILESMASKKLERARDTRWSNTLSTQGDYTIQMTLSRCDEVEAEMRRWDAIIAEAQPYLADIRTWVNPTFLLDDGFTTLQAARNNAPKLVAQQRQYVQQYLQHRQQVVDNWESDAYYLRQMARLWREFFAVVDTYQLYGNRYVNTVEIQQVFDGFGVSLAYNNGQYDIHAHIVPAPTRQYLTPALKSRITGELRTAWTPLADYARKHTPWAVEVIERFFTQLSATETIDEENCLLPETFMPITANRLKQAEDALPRLQPGSPDFYTVYLEQMQKTLPFLIGYVNDSRECMMPLPSPNDPAYATPFGKRYLAVRNEVKTRWEQHRVLAQQAADAEQQKRIEEAHAKLPALLDAFRTAIANAERVLAEVRTADRQDEKVLNQLLTDVRSARTSLFTARDAIVQCLNNLPETDQLRAPAQQEVNQLRGMNLRLQEAETSLQQWIALIVPAAVTRLYNDFQRAYETRDDMRVMSFLSDRWSAGDGTTLDDLEEHFRSMFRVYDTITYRITNMKSEPQENNRYRVTYDLEINGRIFNPPIKREEKATIIEVVVIQGNGKALIERTMEGKFWYER